MTDYEVYDKFFADEEYELENAPTETYSYRSGWNNGLKRASILISDEIRPQGEWIKDCDSCDCSNCYNSGARFTRKDCSGRCSNCGELQCCTDNFCPNCGADMRKSNCVRCDHFGKCEGCERSDEE